MKTVREHIHMKMDFFFHFYFKKFNAFDNILWKPFSKHEPVGYYRTDAESF